MTKLEDLTVIFVFVEHVLSSSEKFCAALVSVLKIKNCFLEDSFSNILLSGKEWWNRNVVAILTRFDNIINLCQANESFVYLDKNTETREVKN